MNKRQGKLSKQGAKKVSSEKSDLRLSRRLRGYIRVEVRRQVQEAVQNALAQAGLVPPNLPSFEELTRKFRNDTPHGVLNRRMIESYDLFLPVCRVLINEPETEPADLFQQKRPNLDSQAVNYIANLRGLKILSEAKNLRRYASYKDPEGKAQFLARAAVGIVFGYTASTSEQKLRTLLRKK